VSAGFDGNAFWSLTPRLYLAHMSGAKQRFEREHKDQAWLVWHIAALSRSEKIPDFKQFVGGGAGKVERQSRETLQAMGDVLAAVWGADPLDQQG